MRSQEQGQVVGIRETSVSLQEEPSYVTQSEDIRDHWMSKLRKKARSYVQGIRQRVRSGTKKSGTDKEKVSLSSRIIQAGVERVFNQVFYVEKGEKLLKASQCNLSTTAGPIAGIVFISTRKVAFHSDRLIKLCSSDGQLIRVPYKVLIPQTRIKRVVSSKTVNKQSQKYVQIVTMDDFEFWFMGPVRYQKSFMSCSRQSLDRTKTTCCNEHFSR